MYLISIYFDNETEDRLNLTMQRVAKTTGNQFMLDNQIPPHITVASVETKHESDLIARIESITKNLKQGEIKFVSVGSFSTKVVFVQPVLNEYLHQLSEIYNKELRKEEAVEIDKRYEPFHWFPHTTLAKYLTKDQMKAAFEIMQNQFGPFEGTITSIGLASTNPYRDLKILELK